VLQLEIISSSATAEEDCCDFWEPTESVETFPETDSVSSSDSGHSGSSSLQVLLEFSDTSVSGTVPYNVSATYKPQYKCALLVLNMQYI
jgi:hypothetical protein